MSGSKPPCALLCLPTIRVRRSVILSPACCSSNRTRIRVSCTYLWLTCSAFSVSNATSGQDAVAVARAIRPDVILLEPIVSRGGVTLVRALRNEPACADAVLVVVTTEARGAQRRQALEAGADAYLIKPCSVKDLGEAIAVASYQRLRLIAPDPHGLTPPRARLRDAVQRCRAIRERLTPDDVADPLIASTHPQ